MPTTKSKPSEWPRIPDEPEGWRELQALAKSERDPKKLEAIIAEMNQLLAGWERRTSSTNLDSNRRAPGKQALDTKVIRG
jgi:hypothetical protein